MLYFLISYLLLGSGSNYQEPIVGFSSDSLQAILKEFLIEYQAPGVVVSIFTDEKVLNLEMAGVKKVGHTALIEEQHLFHLGSNTKAMTGFVAGALVEQGKISWNTILLDIFPEIAVIANKAYKDVTLEDLFKHRAKILEFTDAEDFEQLQDFEKTDDVVVNRIEWCKWLLQQTPIDSFKQGTYTYSNAGYAIAASMLERVSGKNWEELIKEYVLDPLGIYGGFGWPNDIDKSQPWGHYFEEDRDTISYLSEDNDYEIGQLLAPAGDIHMSMSDYIKFLQCNMHGLRGENGVLSSMQIKRLHSLDENEYGYAIGWGIGTMKLGAKKYKFSTHNGSGGTYYCQALIIPELNIGVSIMSNAGDDVHEQGIGVLRNKLLRHIGKQL